MQGLKLTWELCTPMVVGASPLHLDALLTFAKAEHDLIKGYREKSDTLTQELEIPVEKATKDGVACWKASALIATEPGEHAMRFWTRKSDVYDYSSRFTSSQLDVKTKLPLAKNSYSQKFDTVRGVYKQMFKFYPVREIKTLQAWCVGDFDEVAQLLDPENGFINYLGSKTRMGHGRIRSFHIEEDEMAEENWQLRVMPWECPGYVPMEMAVRPPYWDVSNRQRAWVNPEIFN